MPLSHISLRVGKPEACRQAIFDSLYRAMRETLDVPENDQFMIITEHDAADFRYGAAFGIARSDALVFIQITVFNTRTVEQKSAVPAVPVSTRPVPRSSAIAASGRSRTLDARRDRSRRSGPGSVSARPGKTRGRIPPSPRLGRAVAGPIPPQVPPRGARDLVGTQAAAFRKRKGPVEPQVAPEHRERLPRLLPHQDHLDQEPFGQKGALVGEALERDVPPARAAAKQQIVEDAKRRRRQEKIDVAMRARPAKPERLLGPAAEQQAPRAAVIEEAQNLRHRLRGVGRRHRRETLLRPGRRQKVLPARKR